MEVSKSRIFCVFPGWILHVGTSADNYTGCTQTRREQLDAVLHDEEYRIPLDTKPPPSSHKRKSDKILGKFSQILSLLY